MVYIFSVQVIVFCSNLLHVCVNMKNGLILSQTIGLSIIYAEWQQLSEFSDAWCFPVLPRDFRD